MKVPIHLTALCASFATPVVAQTPAPTPHQPGEFILATPDRSTARVSDVESIDAITAALYDVVSGPVGQKRDWQRLRSLYAVDAKVMAMNPTGLRTGGVEDYIARSGPLMEEGGFFEREIARRVESYGNIAHLFSTYEARKTIDGPVFMRGINSIQLVRNGGRWWIATLLWQTETPETPLPAQYLKDAK